MTKGEFVSRIVNGLNSLSKDQRISKRYILHVGERIVEDFLAKHLRDGRLTRDIDLITYIDCLRMEPLDMVKCDIIEFKRCHKLMRSVCKLPDIFTADYGNSIVSVYSVDELTEIKPITLQQYRRNLNRRGKADNLFYYEKDGYLYIPDSEVRTVSLELITMKPEQIIENGCHCEDQEEEECRDIYQERFIIPSKFIDNVVKATIQEVAFKKQIPTDSNPNLNENA